MPDSPLSPRRFCVAPMLDWTDRHDRYFMRLISRHAWLYTEMVTTGAIIHGDRDRHLAFNEAEHPVALQLGGSEPADMAECARIGQDYGYDEININVGCPSERVHKGSFGACLMATPETVAECVDSMRQAVDIPVTIKTRIGIDEQEDYEHLHNFVRINREAGCRIFIVHARKAWLKGLSPKENREVPPLRYTLVYQLKQEFPDLEIIINGGLQDLDMAEQQLEHVDGVMLGRAVYHDPWLLSEVDRRFYGDDHEVASARKIIEQMYPYIEELIRDGGQLKYVTRHMLGMFHGRPGAKLWRRTLSEKAYREGAGIEVVEEALSHLQA
ncbi:MAG: tRNA dihydrouridine(20/20a) synthase DusA [Gammaproteobacteria bacterium]|nr:tRNA dihydrouridine(20/20a) synthase DusA [Gammaproteobacteria bacterium]